MNAAVPLPTITVEEAKTRLVEILKEAVGRPVGISDSGELMAYIVSKTDFDYMLDKLEELENQVWLAKAELARQEGFISAEEVDKFLTDVRNSNNGEAPDIE